MIKSTAELRDASAKNLRRSKGLRQICAAEDMPDRSTVLRWLAIDGGFRNQYALAREIQAEVHAEEMKERASEALDLVKACPDPTRWHPRLCKLKL